MSKFPVLISLFLTAGILLAAGPLHAAEKPGGEAKNDGAKKLKVLVVAGGHGYPVKPFRAVFAGFTDMDCTFVEEKQGGEAFEDITNWPYDAIVLYNYNKKPSDKAWQNFLTLMDRGTGLVILHHAIYGYRPRPEFKNIVGAASWLSGSKDNVEMKIHVADPQHPITKGLKDFTIKDETYKGYGPVPGAHVLLTTDEPENGKAIAWVHQYRKSPVCYFQLGHGPSGYSQPEFGAVLRAAIRWVAR